MVNMGILQQEIGAKILPHRADVNFATHSDLPAEITDPEIRLTS